MKIPVFGKKIICLAAMLLLMLLGACGTKKEELVLTPSAMNIQRGRNYREVMEDFEYNGFINVRTEPIRDLARGHQSRYGEVEQIIVGGDPNYDAGVLVPQDTEVVIRYHSYVGLKK